MSPWKSAMGLGLGPITMSAAQPSACPNCDCRRSDASGTACGAKAAAQSCSGWQGAAGIGWLPVPQLLQQIADQGAALTTQMRTGEHVLPGNGISSFSFMPSNPDVCRPSGGLCWFRQAPGALAKQMRGVSAFERQSLARGCLIEDQTTGALDDASGHSTAAHAGACHQTAANVGLIDRPTDAALATEAQLRAEIERLKQQRMHDQQRIEQLQAEVCCAHRKELAGEIASTLAHDVNNLLFVMGLNVSQLSRASTDPQVKQHVDLISRDLSRAKRTVTDFMSFSGRKAVPQSNQPLADVLQELESLLRQAVGGRGELRVEVEGELGCVNVDRTQLENALFNLVLNARDALDKPDAKVLVRAQVVQVDQAAGARAFVRVAVKDNGCGMSEETLQRACEPFFTTKPAGQGTGLGMGMVERFVAQANGFMQVRSTLGKGTTVALTFPQVV